MYRVGGRENVVLSFEEGRSQHAKDRYAYQRWLRVWRADDYAFQRDGRDCQRRRSWLLKDNCSLWKGPPR